MKISFGTEIITGPWGGGNLFLINLKKYLTSKRHQVVFGLDDKDIDIILFTDPRTGKGSTSLISSKDIKNYKRHINKNVKVVQRINECDERKNTKKINKLYLKSSEVADHVVFVSEWLRKIYLNLGIEKEKTSVIMSGSDKLVFNPYGTTKKPVNRKFKILTHHWSSNWMKGFELYLELDKKLSEPTLKNKIEFTYLGNVDKKYKFSNTKVLQPLSGLELAEEIKDHDIYITGSLNEPSGNHHIEAALCGLPVLYFNSGGIPEYCKGYGLEITMENFEEKILYMIDYFDSFKNKMKKYPYESEKMSANYLKLFNNLRTQ
jgi:glycosyltransferase involved in cell wall biosynthesis